MLSKFVGGMAGAVAGGLVGSVVDVNNSQIGQLAVSGATKLTDFITNTHLGLIRKEHEYMWKHGGKWLYSKFFDAELADEKLDKYWFGSQDVGTDQSNNGERLKQATNNELAHSKGQDVMASIMREPMV